MTTDGSTSASYTYDSNGNRLSRTTSGGTEYGSYDAQDRMTSYGTATYKYKKTGELSQKIVGTDTTKYTYDARGNLIKVALPNGDSVTYVIDGQNRRIGRKVNGVLTQAWLWQGQLAPAAELDGSGNVVSRFVYATHVNVPDYMIKLGVTYRIVTDHLGSVRLVVNTSTGSVAQRIDYDEFGRIRNDSNPGLQPFAYAGGMLDNSTELLRFGARDYDALSGRFTSRDPSGFVNDESNLYNYAAGDAINGADPLGLVVQAPSFGESLIPVWGAGRQAIHDFQCGNVAWGLFNTAVAASDVLLVKSVATGLFRGAWKLGGHSWTATRRWYGLTRNLERGQPVHHWLIERNSEIGKVVPNWLKNQPWNLMEMPNRQFHDAVHGWGPDAMDAFGRAWHGTPAWAKATLVSTGGRIANGANNDCQCH